MAKAGEGKKGTWDLHLGATGHGKTPLQSELQSGGEPRALWGSIGSGSTQDGIQNAAEPRGSPEVILENMGGYWVFISTPHNFMEILRVSLSCV